MYGGQKVQSKHREVGGASNYPGGAHTLTGCQVLSMTSSNNLEKEQAFFMCKSGQLENFTSTRGLHVESVS